MSLTPGAHGGNMDTPEIRSGATVYFGVNVSGGLLAIGDGHCRQGEGEVCGAGIESAMETVVVVDLIKGGGPAWPRIESDEYLMSTGSVRPLEDAFRVSQHDLVTWTGALLGLDDLDSAATSEPDGPCSRRRECRGHQLHDGRQAPESSAFRVEAFDGIHNRLRTIGRSSLRQSG